MTLHPLEILPVVIYLSLLLYLGFSGKRGDDSEENFIVGGRTLTLPAFVATLVTTWYGGILGVGEFSYTYGLSNWVVFGLPYYLFAFIFAVFLAPRIRRDGGLSIPDRLYRNYGPTAGKIGAVWTLFMVLPAPYVLMVGILMMAVTGWSLWLCVTLGTGFSMIYVLSGGFRSVVRTDKLQFILMFGGFILLLTVLVFRYGGLPFLTAHLPASHLSLTGGNPPSYLLVWYFIALWTFIDPGFHQRCDAAKTPETARRGILISIGFWFIFDFLTTATGLYARALLTGLKTPALSYPLLSHAILPPLLSGLFLTGLFATIMSTIDSLSLLSAITIGHDILSRTKAAIDRVKAVRLGLIITAILSILIAILLPSVIRIWYVIGTLFIPPMLLPVLSVYFPVIAPGQKWVVANLVLGFLLPFIWLTISAFQSPSLASLNNFMGIQPMFPGLAVSVALFAAGAAARRRSVSRSRGLE
jgi:solute:Na+ symporter, SSS family